MKEDNAIWVFLSHSNKDFEQVRILRNLLEDNGFRPIMLYLRSKEDSSKVEELRQLIFDEIDHRNRFIYCKSSNAEASKWVDEELKYIKSKDRIFETIDIEQSEARIIEQLNDFRKKSNIFISCHRDDIELAKSIANRLKKYEFNVWNDYEGIEPGDCIVDNITNSLSHAVNNGYVITLLNDRILDPGSWVRKEVITALHLGKIHTEQAIIPVIKDSLLWDKLVDDVELESLCKINPIDSSDFEPAEHSDYIVDEIIKRILPPGAILSHAQNFESGFYGHLDIEEAKKLYAICFKIAVHQERIGSDSANGILGYCYEHGYGTEQNLGLAIDYYREAAKYFPKYQDHYKRLSQQFYKNISSSIENKQVFPKDLNLFSKNKILHKWEQ
ncbi:MAG: TIR domain-containing protein [Bacteroidales bacterium]|nr:TIR domain-containing protein [Bacteroidales bacterium]